MIALAALAFSATLHFEPNRGQAPAGVRYLGAGAGYSALLYDSEVLIRRGPGDALRMKFPESRPEALDRLPGIANYVSLESPGPAVNGVPDYSRIRYPSVFPGIDLVFYANGGNLEYDWIVSAGADPSKVRFWLEDAAGMATAKSATPKGNGGLMLRTKGGLWRQPEPHIYQYLNGRKQQIQGRFVSGRNGVVSFHIGHYDRSQPLVIDPSFVFSTGIGGPGSLYSGTHGSSGFIADGVTSMQVDQDGNIYVAGGAYDDFPMTVSNPGIGDLPVFGKAQSVFVAKIAPDGRTLLYSTVISGRTFSSGLPFIPVFCALAIDKNGSVYVTGTTGTVYYIEKVNAFVARLDSGGVLRASMLFGGSAHNWGESIAVGSDGSIYVAGSTDSSDFPYTAGAGLTDGSRGAGVFLLRISGERFSTIPSGPDAIISSTYIGPGGGSVITVDGTGSVYLAASAANWKTTPGSLQSKCTSGLPTACPDVMVVKFSADATRVLYAAAIGGSGSEGINALAVDSAGNAYLSGATNSDDFPVTPGAFQQSRKVLFASNASGFVAKLNADGSKLGFSTYFDPVPSSMTLGLGAVYIAGAARSYFGAIPIPVLHAIQSAGYNYVCGPTGYSGYQYKYYCNESGFVTAFDTSGGILWSTYVGGGSNASEFAPENAGAAAIATDRAGNIYLAGSRIAMTGSAVNGSVSNDAAIVKIAPGGNPPQITGVTTAAGFHVGLPAPGGIASLFVTGLNLRGTVAASGFPLPLELAGTSVWVDSVAAPILSVSELPDLPADGGTQQINFQVPYEVPDNVDIRARVLELRFNGQSAFAQPQYVAPGLFTTADGSAIIQHAADFSLVMGSNPVRRGEIVVLYGTGFGPVTPLVTSGSAARGAANIQSACGYPSINLGDILYAGLTPGFAGLYQINVRVSDSLTPGTLKVGIDWPHCWVMPVPPNVQLSNTVDVPIQ